MAARLGIVAIRDMGDTAFPMSFPMLEGIAPTTTHGWTWAAFNLFGHGSLAGPQAEAILRGLEKPGLQAWTEDGALWYLMLYAPGREPLRHVHWFRYNDLAEGREKPKKGQTLRAILEHYEDGLPAEYKFSGELPSGPLRAAMAEHLRRRAGDLSEFLGACGVAHEADAVRGALAGDTVTAEEWDWDVGNLPRLLEAIGLEDVIPGWRDQIEDDRAAIAAQRVAAEEARKAPPPDLAEPILRCLGPVELSPIRGGGVTAPLSLLWRLPWACETEVEIALLVRPSRPVAIRWPKSEWLSIVEYHGAWRIGHPWVSVWQREKIFGRLETALRKVPDGSTIEMVSAVVSDEGGESDAVTSSGGNMWFRGVAQKGAWKVTHTSPAVARKDLAAALAIFEWIAKRGPFRAKSAAEAAAIVELGVAGDNFGQKKSERPQASGPLVRIGSAMWRPYLAQAIFRHRFAEGPWDVKSGQQADEQMAADLEKLFADIGAKFEKAFAAPRGEDVVHQGERSTFRRADILQVPSRNGLVELFRTLYPGRDFGESLDLPSAVRAVDEDMGRLGFTPLGDMVCEAFGEIVLRGYGRPEKDAFALLYAGTMGQFLYEFYTDFTDGSSLTTSIHHGKNRPEMKSFHAQYPNASVGDLFEKHREGIAARTKGRAKTADHPLELAALAARMDSFLLRSAA